MVKKEVKITKKKPKATKKRAKKKIHKVAQNRPSTVAKKKKFLEIFKNNWGYISEACEQVDICRHTYYDWREKDKKFDRDCDNVLESNLDFTENALMRNIRAGISQDIRFALKTKGKDRGYVERTEVVNSGDMSVSIGKLTDDEKESLLRDLKEK